LQQAVVSGRNRDGQQLGCSNLVGNRLTIGPQACDVDLDGLMASTARSRHSSIVLPRVKHPDRAGTVTK
jgi:hypothetical protein